MSGPDDLLWPGLDYAAFRAARERFFALVRPAALQKPPAAFPYTLRRSRPPSAGRHPTWATNWATPRPKARTAAADDPGRLQT